MDHEVNELGQAVGLPLEDWQACPSPSGRILQGARVRLERLDASCHIPDLHAAAALDKQGGTWTYLPYGPFATLAEHQAWAQAAASSDDPLFYAVVDPMRGAIGHAALMRIEPRVGVIEIGHVYLAPSLQRSARATEALALLLGECFALGYRRVEWKCNALNVASRRAADRLGFTFEGIFRQATIVKGRNRDTAWFSMLDTEWPGNEAALKAWLASENFDADDRQRRSLASLRAAL